MNPTDDGRGDLQTQLEGSICRAGGLSFKEAGAA